MTETAYQECRKLMQKLNYWRGAITSAEGNVAKWTKIEASFRDQLQEGKANGAKKMLDKAMKKLEDAKKKFAAFTFPDSNLPDAAPVPNKCPICSNLVAQGDTCAECNNG